MANPKHVLRDPARKHSGKSMLAAQAMNGMASTLILLFLPYVVADSFDPKAPWWYRLLSVIVILLAPVFLIMAQKVERFVSLVVASRLLAVLDDVKLTGDRDYVLYLRSFRIDDDLARSDSAGGRHSLTSLASYFGVGNPLVLADTWEGRFARLFRRFGRVLAVGLPGEPLPLPGARRAYLADGGPEWQKDVGKAIRDARLVAIVAAVGKDSGGALGTLWEFNESMRQLPPSQVVLIASGGREDYERFRASAAEYFRNRTADKPRLGAKMPLVPMLPDWPEPRHSRKVTRIPLHGIIRFDAHWMGEFVQFDPTQERGWTPYTRWRRTVRTQITPWMDSCERDLPGDAVFPVRIHRHWHILALAGLLTAVLGVFVYQRRDNSQVWWPAAFLLLAGASTAAQWAALTRSNVRSAAEIRHPTHDDSAGCSNDSPIRGPGRPLSGSDETRYIVYEFVTRWPGRHGIGVSVAEWYHDENHQCVDAPSRLSSWRVHSKRTTKYVAEVPMLGGSRARVRVIHVVQTARRSLLWRRCSRSARRSR